MLHILLALLPPLHNYDVVLQCLFYRQLAYTEVACEYWSHDIILGLLILSPVLFSLEY